MAAGKRPDYVGEYIYPTTAGVTTGEHYVQNTAMAREQALIRMYQHTLTEMCSNRFKWSGMPDTISERYLEMTLFEQALAVFYFDEEFDKFLALRASGLGAVNMYDDPTGFTVYGNQLFSRQLSAADCVPIWANQTRIPDLEIVSIYSQRLAAIDRTFEINMLTARHPVVFAVDSNERKTFVESFNKVIEGQPVIFGSSQLSPENIANKVSMFDLGYKPGQIKDMQEAKARVWNECMTMLGIMNVNNEKKERMVVEEASGASGQVLAMRAVALNERVRAAEKISKKYGLEVTCEWNLDEVDSAQYALASSVAGAVTEGNPALGSTDMEEAHKRG